MDLSIIIPVYNTAPKDLGRCFDSLRISESIAYEVILVDDGSKNETAWFCWNHAAMHPVFRYIRQENRGVSAARNTGLSYAQGRYVMFVDADDALIPSAIQRSHMDNGNDLVFYDHEVIEEKITYQVRIFEKEEPNVLSKKNFIEAACQDKINSSWARLYRRSLLVDHEIFFDESMVVAEDAAFVLKAILSAEQILYAPVPVYQYYHSYKNGDNRLMRFSREIIENTIQLYYMRNDVLERCNGMNILTKAELKILCLDTADRLIRVLFEATGSLLVRKNRHIEIKDIVVSTAEAIYRAYGKRFLMITKFKCFLLKKDWKVVIMGYACLREVYVTKSLGLISTKRNKGVGSLW